MVDERTAANPGARQISANTVRLANGVEATATKAGPCPDQYLCIHDSHDMSVSGRRLNSYDCGFENIGDPGWSDEVGSYVNAQSRARSPSS